MTAKGALAAGLLLGGLAVAAGAFGSHLLAGRLDADGLRVFEIGARYQMYHALALIGLSAWLTRAPAPKLVWTARAWIAGSLVFSGSLYLLALTGQRWLGAITPLGGVVQLGGWFLAAAHAMSGAREPE